MPREYSRKLRVAAELHRLINELLRVEVKDPRLDGVTVNDVELSGDLGVAKLYYGTLDPDADEEEAQEAFERASGFLRSRIGRSLKLRRVPELLFVRDTSAKRGFELRRLIDDLGVEPDEPDEPDEPESDGEPDTRLDDS
jgi:ribosome-binding factor A